MVATARFHVSAATVAGVEPKTGFSPGVIERRRQVIALRSGGLHRISAAIAPAAVSSEIASDLEPLAREILFLVSTLISKVEAELRACETIPLTLQPSIRDLRGEHILFEGDRVTGIVDFGSMRVESPVGDVARLLGSLVGDDSPRRQTGLEAYESVRSLGDRERKVLPAFDHSEVLLSAINWLDWLYRQGRQFDTWQAVLSRIRCLTARLRNLAEQGDIT